MTHSRSCALPPPLFVVAPNFTPGVTFYEGPLRQAIDAKDWDTVGEAVSENGAAWNLGHIDTFTQGVVGGVVELKGPLKIFASVRIACRTVTANTVLTIVLPPEHHRKRQRDHRDPKAVCLRVKVRGFQHEVEGGCGQRGRSGGLECVEGRLRSLAFVSRRNQQSDPAQCWQMGAAGAAVWAY